jgi:hypothetical protein
VRTALPAHLAAAACGLKPGAPITITGGPLGITTTLDVGSGIGSAHDIEISPRRTALLPPKLILMAPSGKVALPVGGVTWATPGAMGMCTSAGRFRANSSMVAAG